MPVRVEASIPSSEAFFNETINQEWRDLTSQTKLPFLVKSPADIVERDNFVKGAASEDLSWKQTIGKAQSLAGQYVGAVLTAVITKAGSGTVHHPEEVVWRTRYETHDVWVWDHWEECEVPISYQDVTPAWDESYTYGAVKLELRNPKTPDNTLLYGLSAESTTGADLFSPAPTITKHICNLLEYAVKTMVKKK